MTANVWRDKNQAPLHPWDIYPHLEPDRGASVDLNDPDRDRRLLEVCKMWAGAA